MCCIALLAGCNGGGNNTSKPSSPAPPPGRAQTVKITVTDTSITSSRTTFVANRPYYFTVTNHGHVPHDFIIRLWPGQAIGNPQPQQGVLYLVPSTKLPPGASRSFTYAFPDSLARPVKPQGNSSNVQFTTQIRGTNDNAVEIPVQVINGTNT